MPPAQDGSPVWVGDPTVPPELQGIHVLGTPLGHDAFQKAALLAKRCQHDSLLDKLPGLPDLQTAWLLLLMCACPRSNYLLRTMQPSTTDDFAARHDCAIMGSLSELLGSDGPLHLDDQALQRAKLPTRRTEPPLGRPLCSLLGLVGRHIAHVARPSSGAVAAAYPLAGHAGAVPVTSGVAELLHAATRLNKAGYMAPGWDVLLAGGGCLFGQICVRCCPKQAPVTRSPSRCFAQHPSSGCLAHAGAFVAVPPPAPGGRASHLQVRWRLLGDHRAACPTAGVLGTRGAPLEWAAARICREAGARVASYVMIRDMNLDAPATDARSIEVLANGLPLWQGAQAAVDSTLSHH